MPSNPCPAVISVRAGLEAKQNKPTRVYNFEYMLTNDTLGKGGQIKEEEDDVEPPHKKQNREAPPDSQLSSQSGASSNQTSTNHTSNTKGSLSKLSDELDMTFSSFTDKNKKGQVRNCVKEKNPADQVHSCANSNDV
jgi:hypothetical protein